MKNNKYIILMFTAVMTLMMSSCSDFLDVNDNPTVATDVKLSSLLPTVIEATSRAHHQAMLSTNRVSHHLDGASSYYGEFSSGSAWVTVYLRALNNLKLIQEKGNSEDAPNYVGIAKVLEAANIGLATDLWENVPYSEALRPEISLAPVYDSQSFIYQTIMTLLDQALPLLATESNFAPGDDDLIYGGDMDKWIAYAHSLKARYMLHLSNQANVNWTAIADEAAQGILDNDGNFQLIYNDINLNPVHDIGLSNQTGNLTVTFGKMFVDLMNGTSYNVQDPRLPLIVHLQADSSTYIGQANYDLTLPETTCEIGISEWYSSPSSAVVMMSAAETNFIMAEAAMKGGGDASAAYKAGIKAHMDMLGVSDDDRMAYMSDAAVDVTDMEHIMKEKYISLIFNPEAWNDLKRLQFDPNLFKGFVRVGIDILPELDRTGPGQRALYPSSEISRNETNVNLNRKDFDAPMWKDQ